MPEFHQGTLVVTRAPHFPTMHSRETVQHLVAYGLDEQQISRILQCLPEEVKLHYADELETGLMRVNSRVMSVILHKALYEQDIAAAKLWLMNRANWRANDNPKQLPSDEQELTTVHQRRLVIDRLLTRATQAKREQETIIDVTPTETEPEAVPARPVNTASRLSSIAARVTAGRTGASGSNGARPTIPKPNGNGANGHGGGTNGGGANGHGGGTNGGGTKR